jgi:hypothetical protein
LKSKSTDGISHRFDKKQTNKHKKKTKKNTDLEARRFQEPTTKKKASSASASASASSAAAPSSSGKGSADAEARRKAMIAAVDAREKAHKQKTKPTKYTTKTTLLRQQAGKQYNPRGVVLFYFNFVFALLLYIPSSSSFVLLL